VIQHCKALGLQEPSTREVWLKPPGNVWKHLLAFNFFKGAQVWDDEQHLFILRLLKAMYELVDGPLLFQLAFISYLVRSFQFARSLHDESFLYYTSKENDYDYEYGELFCVIIVHVDDLLAHMNTAFVGFSQ